jgi:hypothetical protein
VVTAGAVGDRRLELRVKGFSWWSSGKTEAP